MVPAAARVEVEAYASQLPSIQHSERSVCDLELLATGAFSPLDRFMGQADYERVLDEMRLARGPAVPDPGHAAGRADPAPTSGPGRDVALRDAKNDLLAVMTVEEMLWLGIGPKPAQQRSSARRTCATRWWPRCSAGAR